MVFDKHRQIESMRHSLELSASSVRLAGAAAPIQTPRRLLFVAYQFAPSLEMGARSCTQIARYLPLYGWSPVVLTAHEKYIEERYRGSNDEIAELGLPDAVVRTRLLPHPLDFYRWLKSALRRKPQDAGGSDAAETTVVVDEPPGAKGKLRRLLLSALSIPDMYTGWILPAVVAGLKAARQSKAEQIFSSGPFWTNHLVGFALSYLTGLPWVAHFRDPWFAGSWETPTSAIAARMDKWLERLIVTRATAVVGVTEEHAAAFRRTYPHLPADKFAAVPNGYDNGEWDNLPAGIRRDEKSEGKFLIVYAGTFYI